jgi:hypothetical protein
MKGSNMKKALILIGALTLAAAAQAQWIVYDPAVHTQQILDQAQNVAKYIEMIDNQIQQINTLTSQLQQLQQYNTAFGNPAALLNITGANQLASDLNRAVVGQPLVTIQMGSQGSEAMTFNGNGLYHNIGQTFQTPSGNEIQRQEDIYRENAAAQNATQNYTDVVSDATQRRLTLRANISATIQQLQNATTASEVQKLSGVLVGLDADLADTDKEIDQAANQALVQDAENRNDKDKQSKARLEEQQAEFSEAMQNYGQTFQPITAPPIFPVNNQ